MTKLEELFTDELNKLFLKYDVTLAWDNKTIRDEELYKSYGIAIKLAFNMKININEYEFLIDKIFKCRKYLNKNLIMTTVYIKPNPFKYMYVESIQLKAK